MYKIYTYYLKENIINRTDNSPSKRQTPLNKKIPNRVCESVFSVVGWGYPKDSPKIQSIPIVLGLLPVGGW